MVLFLSLGGSHSQSVQRGLLRSSLVQQCRGLTNWCGAYMRCNARRKPPHTVEKCCIFFTNVFLDGLAAVHFGGCRISSSAYCSCAGAGMISCRHLIGLCVSTCCVLMLGLDYFLQDARNSLDFLFPIDCARICGHEGFRQHFAMYHWKHSKIQRHTLLSAVSIVPVFLLRLQEFEYVEFFAGHGNITRQMRSARYCAVRMDIIDHVPKKPKQQNYMDLCSPCGFALLAWSLSSIPNFLLYCFGTIIVG